MDEVSRVGKGGWFVWGEGGVLEAVLGCVRSRGRVFVYRHRHLCWEGEEGRGGAGQRVKQCKLRASNRSGILQIFYVSIFLFKKKENNY